MPNRDELIATVADTILALPFSGILRVGIDGVDGAGKTVFADELASLLRNSSRQIIRSGTDFFHNSRAVRYQRGKTSPEGFYLDSFNLDLIKATILDPLSPGGGRRYRTAAFDHRSDSPVIALEEYAEDGAILIFDGIFLHRPELRSYWDFSLFLDVPFSVSVVRCATRDGGDTNPEAAANSRYVEGQKIYLEQCTPQLQATIVIDNSDLASPFIVA